jgi:hypothetical protein
MEFEDHYVTCSLKHTMEHWLWCAVLLIEVFGLFWCLMEFYRYGLRISTLEHSFQNKSASPPTQIQNMYPSHPEPDNTWTKASLKRDRTTHEDEEDQRETKRIMESEYRLHVPPTATQR